MQWECIGCGGLYNNICPKHLYDTLSSFSNQDDGGTIIFGVDEKQNYKEVGVYDPQDIQKKINEQCLQMEPIVRPLLTVVEKEDKFFVAAEIPGADLVERPVFYQGRGRVKGSYTRIGDSDEPMTEYEVYSYEAYRKKYQDDIRTVSRATFASLKNDLLETYIQLLKDGKPHLSAMEDEEIYELMSIKRNDEITISTVLNFSPYPQAYFPQLCITAIVVPGNEIGVIGEQGERFLDNQRIEGCISEMLEGAMKFVIKNMRFKTIINPQTGKREDRSDYPIPAIREAILNALVHRDYSIHTEGMPIQIIMFDDRIEIRRTMEEYNLREPEFSEERGSFVVRLYKHEMDTKNDVDLEGNNDLILFCRTPRTRKEICDYLGLNSVTYAIQTHIMPLVEAGKIKMSIPDKPKSPKQLFYSE